MDDDAVNVERLSIIKRERGRGNGTMERFKMKREREDTDGASLQEMVDKINF